MKHVGSRIIDEHRRENALLKQILKQAGVKIPAELDKPDSPEEELTKSEEAKLKEYYALRQQ